MQHIIKGALRIRQQRGSGTPMALVATHGLWPVSALTRLRCAALRHPCDPQVIPGYTCSAVADAVVQAGGTPVVVDCEVSSSRALR